MRWMIIDQMVEMTWNGRNKKYYIEKGYNFTKIGDKFKVNTDDLARTSKVKVVVVCDTCNCSKYTISYYAANKSSEHVCKSCKATRNQIKVACGFCKIEFVSTKSALNKSVSGNLFCSNQCVGKYNGLTMDRRVLKTCLMCDKEYKVKQVHKDTSVACSIECQSKWQSTYLTGENANNFRGGNRIKECKNCRETFYAGTPSEFINRVFCGLKCKHIYWEENTVNSDFFIKRRAKGNIEYRKKMSENYIETKPEKMVRELLEQKGLVKNIDFYQEKSFFGKYFTDFFFPSTNLIIEVMGDYWHANPQIYGESKIPLNTEQEARIIKDKEKKEDFIEQGYHYIEIWESDIYNDLEKEIEACFNYIPVTTARRTS